MGKLKKQVRSKDSTVSRRASQANHEASTEESAEPVLVLDRRGQGRRKSADRRQQSVPVAVERRTTERRKVQRRRQIDPTTCERDYTETEIEFMSAMDAYKRSSGRMFPTCSEILEVLRGLGYEKQAKPVETAEAAPVATEPTPPSAG